MKYQRWQTEPNKLEIPSIEYFNLNKEGKAAEIPNVYRFLEINLIRFDADNYLQSGAAAGLTLQMLKMSRISCNFLTTLFSELTVCNSIRSQLD